MKIFTKRRKESVLSRREIAAQRQANLQDEGTPSPRSYQKNRMLNSRQTATPVETSERLVTYKLANQRRRLVKQLVWVVAICVFALFLLWESVVLVDVSTPQAMKPEDAKKYTAVLDSYYEDRPIERLRFLLDEANVKSFFLAHAPEVQTVRLEGQGIAKARMKLTFRQPTAQWTSGDTTYFVDDDGVTFERNYFIPPAVMVRDESGVSAVAGQEVINRQFLSFLGQTVAAFKKEHMIVSEAILPANTVRQVFFQIQDRAYPIKMTIDRGASAQVSQAVATIRHLEVQGIIPQYIDVRVDQRTFYK